MNVNCKALVVTAENDEIVVKSAANIPTVLVTFANLINVYDILNAKGSLVYLKNTVKNVKAKGAAANASINPQKASARTNPQKASARTR